MANTTSSSIVNCTVNGKVQGVGYRNWVYSQAKLLKLTGYVQNLVDGGVEVVAEGERAALERFVDQLGVGPKLAKVKNVSCVWSNDSRSMFADFVVKKQ